MRDLAPDKAQKSLSNTENVQESDSQSSVVSPALTQPNFQPPSSPNRHSFINPNRLTPDKILSLQRTIGNKAVNHLLSARQPKEIAQQGVDQAKQQVSPASSKPNESKFKSVIQRLVSKNLIYGDPVIISHNGQIGVVAFFFGNTYSVKTGNSFGAQDTFTPDQLNYLPNHDYQGRNIDSNSGSSFQFPQSNFGSSPQPNFFQNQNLGQPPQNNSFQNQGFGQFPQFNSSQNQSFGSTFQPNFFQNQTFDQSNSFQGQNSGQFNSFQNQSIFGPPSQFNPFQSQSIGQSSPFQNQNTSSTPQPNFFQSQGFSGFDSQKPTTNFSFNSGDNSSGFDFNKFTNEKDDNDGEEDRINKRKRNKLNTGGSNKRRRIEKREPQPNTDLSNSSPTSEEAIDLDIESLTEQFSKMTISFDSPLDGGSHKIYPKDNLEDVIIESDPTPLAVIIAQKSWLGIKFTKPEMKELKSLRDDIQEALNDLKLGITITKNQALRDAMYATSKFLKKKGGVKIPKTDLSGSDYFANSTADTVGKKVIANPLSSRTDVEGSKANDSNLMSHLRTKVKSNGGKRKDPVQAHLLNMKTWGPGELWNLTPASKKFNSKMESGIETLLKKAIIDAHLVIYFEAEVSYNNHPIGPDYTTNPEKYLFTQIKFSAEQLHEDTTSNTYIYDNSIAEDPLVTQMNTRMKWDQGNLPELKAKPKIFSETDPTKFTEIGFSNSVAQAITSLNKAVAAGKLPRKTYWKSNIGIDNSKKELKRWLNHDQYTGKAKTIVWSNPPSNWKQSVDWTH